jgi:hypothetical protein
VLSDLTLAPGATSPACHNVLLTVDGFALPPEAPVDLLRDGDLVVLLPAAVQVGADAAQAVQALKWHREGALVGHVMTCFKPHICQRRLEHVDSDTRNVP